MNVIKNQFEVNQKGFSLLEVVLVTFLVAFTFTGIYMSLSKISRHEKDVRYGLIASNLAQEGVEIIRNKRDQNLLEDSYNRYIASPAQLGLDMNDELSSIGTCYPYWDGSSPVCDSGRKKEIELDGNGVYRNCESSGCSGDSTPFERVCEITDSDEYIIEAYCEVEWKSPSLGTDKSVRVESYLTSWQRND